MTKRDKWDRRVKARLPEGTYIELVRSLFRTLLPTAIMALSFLVVGLLIATRTRNTVVELLVALGSIAAATRICILLLYRSQAGKRVFGPRMRIEIGAEIRPHLF